MFSSKMDIVMYFHADNYHAGITYYSSHPPVLKLCTTKLTFTHKCRFLLVSFARSLTSFSRDWVRKRTNSRNCGDNLAQLQLVDDGSLTGGIETHLQGKQSKHV